MLRDFLRAVPLFEGLSEEQLAGIEALVREVRVPAEQMLFREGDPVDAFYLVKRGGVTVFRDSPGKPMQVLARLEEGGFFGEMGLLNRTRRLASARTSIPAVLLAIDKADLLDLLQQNPALELKLRAEIIRRHGMNVSALLGLAGQRDVRIRLGAPAELEMPDGSRLSVTLENLSLGGIALAGIPFSWELGQAVRFGLSQPGQEPLLEVSGAVSWRETDRVGISFSPDIVGDGTLIHRVLRRFLEAAGEGGGGEKPGLAPP